MKRFILILALMFIPYKSYAVTEIIMTDGTVRTAMTAAGAIRTVSQPYGWSMQEGQLLNHKGVKTNGERPSVALGVSDVWSGVTTDIPIPPDAGDLISIVSTSVQDLNLTGTGIWSIDLDYIDPADGSEKEVHVLLNGTTVVNTGLSMRYINAMHTHTTDGTKYAIGNITAFKTGTPTKVYKIINIGNNSNLSTDYMVPGGKTMFITHWFASSAGAGKPVAMRLVITAKPDGTLLPRTFLVCGSVYLETSSFSCAVDFPVRVTSYGIIKFRVEASQAGPYVSAGFGGWLEDTEVY